MLKEEIKRKVNFFKSAEKGFFPNKPTDTSVITRVGGQVLMVLGQVKAKVKKRAPAIYMAKKDHVAKYYWHNYSG